jgi:hypothetical protein
VTLITDLLLEYLQWSVPWQERRTKRCITVTLTRQWFVVFYSPVLTGIHPLFQIPLFDKDTNGSSNKLKHIMGRRNWTSVTWDSDNGDLVFDIRVEIEKGNGVTKGCVFSPLCLRMLD